MNKQFETTLDELIDFILTDKYVRYSVNEINQLKSIINEKLALILDESEYEFYKGVTDELIEEMIEKMPSSDKKISNPLKSKYDTLSVNLCADIDKALNNSVIEHKAMSHIKCSHNNSLLRFTVAGMNCFHNVLSNICSISINNSRFLYLGGGESHYNGDGESSDNLLTELGRPKNV